MTGTERDDLIELLDQLDLVGTIQVASFHPDYQFADLNAGDVCNYTNRSPYPMWHLLREAGLERALEHHPDPEGIPARNVEAMRELGHEALASALARLRG